MHRSITGSRAWHASLFRLLHELRQRSDIEGGPAVRTDGHLHHRDIDARVAFMLADTRTAVMGVTSGRHGGMTSIHADAGNLQMHAARSRVAAPDRRRAQQRLTHGECPQADQGEQSLDGSAVRHGIRL